MVTALQGLTCIEISRVLPGAFCTRMLADMGANVIKIEEPHRKFPGGLGKEKWRRASFDRNKKSLFLDLKLPEGQKILHDLATSADVVVEGFRPGVIKRLGADYETLSNINPRIVLCSLSGYGQTGPYSNMPGHDLNYISVAGAQDLIGLQGQPPAIPLNLLADVASAALHGVIGILTAIIAREHTGRGQYVDVSYMDGVFSMLSAVPQIADYLLSGTVPRRGEGVLGGAYPYYNLYKTKDEKYIAVACMEAHFWENLCQALERPDLSAYKFSQEHFNSPSDEEWQKAKKELDDIFISRTREEWVDLLSSYDVCVSRVNSVDEAFTDVQCIEREMLQEKEDEHWGKIKQIGIPVKLSDTPGIIRSLAPKPGKHTEEILTSLGYSGYQIQQLIEKKVTRLES